MLFSSEKIFGFLLEKLDQPDTDSQESKPNRKPTRTRNNKNQTDSQHKNEDINTTRMKCSANPTNTNRGSVRVWEKLGHATHYKSLGLTYYKYTQGS